MSRYKIINMDEFVDFLRNHTKHITSPDTLDFAFRVGFEHAQEFIEHAEDLTECQHCIHSSKDGFICMGTGMMPAHKTFPNDYCSFGEPVEN